MLGYSLLNDILGPVMRGPSSSHAAAPYAMFDVGRALPANLRCMAKDGLAVSPTALRLVADFRKCT
jgi:hypothetical protein